MVLRLKKKKNHDLNIKLKIFICYTIKKTCLSWVWIDGFFSSKCSFFMKIIFAKKYHPNTSQLNSEEKFVDMQALKLNTREEKHPSRHWILTKPEDLDSEFGTTSNREAVGILGSGAHLGPPWTLNKPHGPF